MSVDSAFAQLGENLESSESVNPIVTPASSLHLPIADNTSTNGDNDPQLPIRGRLGIEVEDPESALLPRERRPHLAYAYLLTQGHSISAMV